MTLRLGNPDVPDIADVLESVYLKVVYNYMGEIIYPDLEDQNYHLAQISTIVNADYDYTLTYPTVPCNCVAFSYSEET